MADETINGQGEHGDTKAQSLGSKGDRPAAGGHGDTRVTDGPAEKAEGQLNPSSPGNTGTTPGTNARLG